MARHLRIYLLLIVRIVDIPGGGSLRVPVSPMRAMGALTRDGALDTLFDNTT